MTTCVKTHNLLQGRALFYRKKNNQEIIACSRKFHTSILLHWHFSVFEIRLPLHLIVGSKEEKNNLLHSQYLPASSQSFHPLIRVSRPPVPLQVLGSWEGSLGRVSSSSGREGFMLWPFLLSLTLFPCIYSIYPYIWGS